jgi:hypothetical protein
VVHRLKAAGVDRDVRGWEKASDQAPTWVELTNARRSGPRTGRYSALSGRASRKYSKRCSAITILRKGSNSPRGVEDCRVHMIYDSHWKWGAAAAASRDMLTAAARRVQQVSHLHLPVVHPTHAAAWHHGQSVLVSAPMPTKATDFEG